MSCFACHCPSHFQSHCKFPPFCLICRQDGHLTVDCANRYPSPPPPVVKHFGSGLPGCEFFALVGNLDSAPPVPVVQNAAVISVLSEGASLQILEDELGAWGPEGWDWQIQQLTPSSFGVIFPSKDNLRMIASCSSFTLPRNHLVISVKEAVEGGKAFVSLTESWVLLDDVPSTMCSVPAVLVFAELVGRPVSVDPASLSRPGPVRVLINCLDPTCICGHVLFFPDIAAYRIFVRLEGSPLFLWAHRSPPPSSTCSS